MVRCLGQVLVLVLVVVVLGEKVQVLGSESARAAATGST